MFVYSPAAIRWGLLASLLSFTLIGLQAQSVRVGAAKVILTPDPLLPVSGGIGTPKPVTMKHGDLYARVMVIEQGGERVAIVGLDNLGWPKSLGDRSRALVPGIPPENILIGATHTHSAPDAYGFPDLSGRIGADTAYISDCVIKIAAAINEAVQHLEPAWLRIGEGEAVGKIAYNYYAPQLYDPRCNVVQAVAANDTTRTLATLINYAIHPEVIGSERSILSPDVCGPLYDYVEKETGGTAVFMNGALGGMVTADNRRSDGQEAADWQECKRIGELLGKEALRIVGTAPWQQTPQLTCRSMNVTFPIESPMLRQIIQMSPLMQGMADDNISTQVNLINLGTAQILTIPGEALPNIGYYLKRKMKGTQNFLFGLTNDAFGYILTQVDFNSFKRYDYVTRTSLGEMTGEIFIEKALELVASSPAPDQPE